MREPSATPVVNLARLARLARRVMAWFRRSSVELAMDDEMRYHIDCEIDAHVARGLSRDEARRIALRDFGGVDRHKEDARDVRGLRVADDTLRDASYALRVLRRNPGFATAVILTFALGVGCTTAIFSLVNAMLIRPLPYARPDELVVLWERNAARGSERNVVSVPAFEAWRDRTHAFSDMAAMVPSPTTIAGSPAERISAAEVSTSYFGLLGVQPAIGRDFSPADGVVGAARVTILSNAMWRSRFGADRSIVGRTIVLDGEAHTIIGVMPPDFEPPRFGWMSEQPMWLPFVATADNRSWGRFLHVIARRAPGVAEEQARADLRRVGDALAEERDSNKGWSNAVVPLAEQLTGDVRTPLLVVFAAVSLLLLMSIVNVGNLVTGFVRRRAHELTVRRAIGATVGRLVRQQLVQSLMLGLIGAVAAVGVAVVATRLLVALMPPDVPRVSGVRVDGPVLVFAALIALATTLLVGIAAALRGVESLNPVSANRVSARMGGSRLVVAEIAIGLVLTALAVLMVRSLVNLRSVNLGFDARSVVAGRVSLPRERFPTDAHQYAFFDAFLAKARALPGVTSASVATTRPLACCAPATSVFDAQRPDPSRIGTTDIRYVDESYFTALRIPVLAGAVFARTEARNGPPRAVISRSVAVALWGPGANAIGRSISMNLSGTTTAEVIGVVADLHLADVRTPSRPALFLSTSRFPSTERDIIVRGAGDPDVLLRELREALASLDPTIPLYRATTLDAAVGTTLAQDRFTTLLLSGFALLSLGLAAVGVYGVLSGDVIRRRKEIGIRLALGARPGQVLSLVLRRALWPTAAGVVIGMILALALARSMSSMVFGIGTWDLVSFATVALVLAAAAGLATLVPALRASRVAPVDVIRAE